MDSIGHGPSEHLGERFSVAPICASQCVQVSRAVSLVDHCRRIPVPNEEKIGREATHSSVAVAERMDSFETSVEVGDEEHRVLVAGRASIRIS